MASSRPPAQFRDHRTPPPAPLGRPALRAVPGLEYRVGPALW